MTRRRSPASLRNAATDLGSRLGPGAPRVRDRITQGRVKLTFGVRAVNHAVLAVKAVGLHGRSKGWLAAGAASIGVDAALARLLDDPAYLPSWPQWVLEWLDGALWACATESRGDVMYLLTGMAMPTVAATTVEALAGTGAVPELNPARPWPPADGADAARRLARVAAVTFVPLGIAVVVRRRRGLPGGAENILWNLSTAAIAAFGARHRDRLHRDERRRWAERTAAQVSQERAAAQASLATTSSPGHDFKKTLFALGLYGSPRAMAEARAQTAHPTRVLQALGGHTLFEVTRSTRIVPADAGTQWLTVAQGRRVRSFLRSAEEGAADGADLSLHVDRTNPREIVMRYLGCELRLRNDPPPLRARLDPSSVTLAIAAFMAADTALLGELPLPAVVPSVGLLLWCARRFRRRSPSASELRLIMACCTLSTALGFALSASRWARVVTPLGDRSLPAGSFAKGFLVVLGAHWSRFGAGRHVLLPAIFAGWTAATVHRQARRPAELVAGGLDLLQALAATWKLSDLVDAEAHHLERVLQAEFSLACEQARAAAVREELDRYAHQLDVARQALAELEPRLDPVLVAQFEEDCRQLEAWLRRQRTGRSLDPIPALPPVPAR